MQMFGYHIGGSREQKNVYTWNEQKQKIIKMLKFCFSQKQHMLRYKKGVSIKL